MDSLIDLPTIYMLLFLGVFGSIVVTVMLVILTILSPAPQAIRENIRKGVIHR